MLDSPQFALWMCYLKLPPIFAVYVSTLCVHTIFDVPHFPHPVEAAVEPAVHFSKHYATPVSIFHHVFEPLL